MQIKVENEKSYKSNEVDGSDKTLAKASPGSKVLSKIPTIKKLSQINENSLSLVEEDGEEPLCSNLVGEGHAKLVECSKRRLVKSPVNFSRR